MTTASKPRTVPLEEHQRLARLVIECLALQQRYFRSRSPEDLTAAKVFERRLKSVAEAAIVAARREPALFDRGVSGDE